MNGLLEFHDVAVARGDRVLLRGVAGAVAAGEVLHVRGANGIGKTSLLEVLAGLRRAEVGTVVRGVAPEDCHWIGHRNAVNPALTAHENLRFWCALNDVPSDGIRTALREFDLQNVADRPCRQLSAGQKRRVALARLAVVRRTLWFLDEPLSALDQAGVERWLALLAQHQGEGGAAVVTSHQPLANVTGLRMLELGGRAHGALLQAVAP